MLIQTGQRSLIYFFIWQDYNAIYGWRGYYTNHNENQKDHYEGFWILWLFCRLSVLNYLFTFFFIYHSRIVHGSLPVSLKTQIDCCSLKVCFLSMCFFLVQFPCPIPYVSVFWYIPGPTKALWMETKRKLIIYMHMCGYVSAWRCMP